MSDENTQAQGDGEHETGEHTRAAHEAKLSADAPWKQAIRAACQPQHVGSDAFKALGAKLAEKLIENLRGESGLQQKITEISQAGTMTLIDREADQLKVFYNYEQVEGQDAPVLVKVRETTPPLVQETPTLAALGFKSKEVEAALNEINASQESSQESKLPLSATLICLGFGSGRERGESSHKR